MQVFATFEHSMYLELAISKLEENDITDIFAVPLDNRQEEQKLFDSLHRSDGTSFISKGMILAVLFSVVGASRGFVLEWGPIYWGLIGAVSGFIIGFGIDLLIHLIKNKNRSMIKGKHSEVILIIECENSQAQQVEKILWDHLALGVAKIKEPGNG
jgi:hypothetical protein